MAIKCRVCSKTIRGNAAREDYNATTQENTYLCRACDKLTHAVKTYDVFWAPEGRKIATVQATNERRAIRKAPMPYRKYLGEMYAQEAN